MALLAQGRKHRLNLDKGQAFAAKNYEETNFAAEKDRKFDDAKINEGKTAELAKKKKLRKNLRKGEDYWKRQVEEDGFGSGFGGLGGGLYAVGFYGGGGFEGGFERGLCDRGIGTLRK